MFAIKKTICGFGMLFAAPELLLAIPGMLTSDFSLDKR